MVTAESFIGGRNVFPADGVLAVGEREFRD